MTTDSTSTGPSANAGPPWEVVEPAATEQAAGAATSTDLAVFDSIEKTIVDIEARHKNVVYDLTTTKGNDAARKARKELVSARTAADDTYTAWNQPILEKQANARVLRDGFKARVKLIEEPLDKAIEADEKRRTDEKKAKDLAEANRLKAIRDRISDIYAQPAACAGQASSEIELSIVGVEVLMTNKAFFEELQGEAEAAADVVLTKLRSMMSAAKASEGLAKAQKEEADRLAEERAQLERDRAELARQQEAARQALADAEATRQAEAAAAAAKEAAARAEREAADRQKESDLAEKLRLAKAAADALTQQATERLAEQQHQLDEQRRQLDERRDQITRDQEAAKDAATRELMSASSPHSAPALNRVEHTSESGATIVSYTRAAGQAAIEDKTAGSTGGNPAQESFRQALAGAAAGDESKPPVTVQIDAFEVERQAEAARAAALPKPPVKRPEDERLTAAVAKAFEVEPAIAAEWLGTYDAFEEIARLQGAPA